MEHHIEPAHRYYDVATPRRIDPTWAVPMAQFRFAYATPDSAFAAELTVPANTAAGVVLVVGVVLLAVLLAASV